MTRAGLVAALLLGGAAQADEPQPPAANAVAFIRGECAYLASHWKDTFAQKLPHVGKVLRVVQGHGTDEYHVAAVALPGWDVSVSPAMNFRIDVPRTVQVTLADLERLLGPAAANADDYRLASPAARKPEVTKAPPAPAHYVDFFEFSRKNTGKLCYVAAHTDGALADVHRQRVLWIEFTD